MKRFRDLSLEYQAIKVYLLGIIISLIFYYPFNKFYIWIFKPAMFGGDLFFPIPDITGEIINGALFAFYLFLPILVFSLIRRKQWLIWFIGAVVPLIIALVGGRKDFFWAIIFSLAGWLLAQGILLIKKQVKK